MKKCWCLHKGNHFQAGSHFQLLFEKLLQNEPKNNMHFCLKILKLDNIPSIRYKMIWTHHVQVVKQNISFISYSCWYTIKIGKITIFCGCQQNNPKSQKGKKIKVVIMNYLQANSRLNWLNILRDNSSNYRNPATLLLYKNLSVAVKSASTFIQEITSKMIPTPFVAPM